jgi:signal transduction histidine kinase
MHPLGYFASAPDGTFDAAILSELVSRYGSYLERLNSEQKLALRAILSYYLFYKLKVVSDYSVTDAITDAMPEYTEASIRNVIATLEGISSNNAEGLIKFLTDQRSDRAVVLGEAAPHSHTSPIHSQKLAMVDRLAALQKQLQQMGRNHQTELDTLQLQMQTDLEAVNRELNDITAFVSHRYRNGSSAPMGTAQGGQQ